LERSVEEQFEIEDYINLYVKLAVAFKTIWAQGGIFLLTGFTGDHDSKNGSFCQLIFMPLNVFSVPAQSK